MGGFFLSKIQDETGRCVTDARKLTSSAAAELVRICPMTSLSYHGESPTVYGIEILECVICRKFFTVPQEVAVHRLAVVVRDRHTSPLALFSTVWGKDRFGTANLLET